MVKACARSRKVSVGMVKKRVSASSTPLGLGSVGLLGGERFDASMYAKGGDAVVCDFP